MEQAVRGSYPGGEIEDVFSQIRMVDKIRSGSWPQPADVGSLPSKQTGPANSKLFSASQKKRMQQCIESNLMMWQPLFTEESVLET